MNKSENLYEILGISKNATKEEIDKAYRAKARQHHPDRFTKKEEQDAATEKFQSISEAYRTLSDEGKRRIYDATGSKDGNPSDGGFGGGNNGSYGFGGFNNFHEGFNFGNFGGSQGFNFTSSNGFDGAFDFNDFFSMFSGGGRSRSNVQKYQMDITVEEAFNGANKQIMITENVKCVKCSNTRVAYCSECNGSKYVKQTKKQDINIPGGVKTGDAMMVNNSVQILFNVKSSKYEIENTNLILNVEVTDVEFTNNKPISLTDLNGQIFTVDISKHKIVPTQIIIHQRGLWTDTNKKSRGSLIINISVRFTNKK